MKNDFHLRLQLYSTDPVINPFIYSTLHRCRVELFDQLVIFCQCNQLTLLKYKLILLKLQTNFVQLQTNFNNFVSSKPNYDDYVLLSNMEQSEMGQQYLIESPKIFTLLMLWINIGNVYHLVVKIKNFKQNKKV